MIRSSIRRHIVTIVALTLLLLPAAGGLAQQDVVFPAATWERISEPELYGYSPAGLESLTAYTEEQNTTAAMAVLGGRVLWEYGDVTRVSYLASVRKSVLAMLYGNYVADGTIDLDKTLEQMDMDDIGGLTQQERQATIRHLIMASSGIYHPASNPGDNLDDAPPRGSQAPGTYFLYSNWDFNAAGGAFERATGRDIFDALQTDLAEPIGMRDFNRDRHRKGGDMERSLYPSYHMHLSTRDMARVGYVMLREGNWAGRQVIPRDWARQIVSVVTPVAKMNPEPLRQGPFGYGYMWWVWDGEAATGAFSGAYTGRGAYGQYITVLPALDMVVAHKTVPDATTSWDAYQGILDLLVAAHCGDSC
ncbi:MAG: serine hydrolase [Acidobacteriota bacterium]|jgi:CubicO group peptidase (beta-lactamase class C family)